MGLFSKKKKETVPTREEKLLENAKQPFTTEILDNVEDAHLGYCYTNVECTIIGNTDGLIEGAVLYARRNGILANAASEKVAQIDNKKIKDMVNDFYDKERFCTVRTKFTYIENGKLFCNIGFFIDDNPDHEEADSEDKYTVAFIKESFD